MVWHDDTKLEAAWQAVSGGVLSRCLGSLPRHVDSWKLDVARIIPANLFHAEHVDRTYIGYRLESSDPHSHFKGLLAAL